MNLDLSGKNALVCGSTQGIGKAVALELAQLGANVILLARDEEKLKSTLAELSVSAARRHRYLCSDFGDPADLRSKVEKLIAELQIIHILVNNTGGPAGGPALSAKSEEFVQTFSNHLLCNHLLVQVLAEGMKKAKYGRIINIISTSVKQPIKGLGVSNTIRAAVANWAKTLAGELGPFGVTVNNVLPGATLTGRLSSLLEAKAQKTALSLDQLKKDMLDEIPAGRFADPSEVAAAVAFLATPAAGYINGINVPVDGGRTMSL